MQLPLFPCSPRTVFCDRRNPFASWRSRLTVPRKSNRRTKCEESSPSISVEDEHNIFMRWWRRRTSMRKQSRKKTHSDDEPSSDEDWEALYPSSLKLNLDACLSQLTCQGIGWYHVHDQQQACTLRSSAPNSPEDAVALQDLPVRQLPPEVIHRILELLLDGEGYFRTIERTSAALVCKHWAKIRFRPNENRRHRLHGRTQVMALRSLVCAPGSYLQRSIVHFNVMLYSLATDGSKTDPWLHLVPSTRRLLPNYARKNENDWVSIDGPLRHGLRTMRSIHAYLPRSMPPAFSHGIHTLSLRSIQFASFRDLQRVLGELPCLERFYGRHLSWPRVSNTPAPLRLPSTSRRARGAKPMEATLLGCTCNLEAVTLCAAPHGHVHAALRAVCETLVLHDAEYTVKTAWKFVADRDHPPGTQGSPAHAILYNIHISSPPEKGYVDKEFELRILFPCAKLPLPPQIEPITHRYRATLVLWSDLTPRYMTSIDWNALNEALTTHIETARMVFGCTARLDFPEKYSTGGLYKCNLFCESGWTVLSDHEQQFIVDSLSSLAAADKISFSKPPREMVWNEDEAWPLQ